MKRKFISVFLLLLIFFSVNCFAQSDLFGGFTTGKSTSSSTSSSTQVKRNNSNNTNRSSTSYSKTSSSNRQQSSSARSNNQNTQKSTQQQQINKKIKSKRSYNRKDGGVYVLTVYEDDSTLEYSEFACTSCNGDGRCTSCNGRGSWGARKCMGCNGFKTCSTCGGVGRLETETFRNSVGAGWCKNLRTGNTTRLYGVGSSNAGVGGISTSSSSGISTKIERSGSKSLYTKCSYCNATGKCSSCKGYGYHDNTLNAEYIKCGSCNGNGRCFNCYGRGYY